MSQNILLRDVRESDLPIFFEQQLDPEANYMAAFTAKDPTNREAFKAHWAKILAEPTVIQKTVEFEGQVAGYLGKYELEGNPEITYWIGKEYWGKGLATVALGEFLRQLKVRPLYASAAGDNIGSIRVLEKCGFTRTGRTISFANARGAEIEEVFLELR